MITLVVQLVIPKLIAQSSPFHLHSLRGVDHSERERIESAPADEVLERMAPEDDAAPIGTGPYASGWLRIPVGQAPTHAAAMLARSEHFVGHENSGGAGAEIVARREPPARLNTAGAR